MSSILSDYLQLLGVPHTSAYTARTFHSMPFKSLFGFSRLLAEYGVPSEAWQLSDKDQITDIPTPFLAQKGCGFVIVTGIEKDASGATVIDYVYYHKRYKDTLEKFNNRFTGTVLLSFPTDESREPDYSKHHFYDIVGIAKRWLLILSGILLLAFGFVYAGLYSHLSTIFLTLVNLAGLAVTWMLLKKSLKIHSKSADKICGILQQHGCDTVLEQKAASFFGIFGWSEVGFTYFSVSTAILLIFPGEIHTLALLNGCCLPFTVWSIWYQKFRIHTWCTLCVTTQCLLWLQFFCFLFGGWWSTGIWPLHLSLIPILAAYAGTLMAVNGIVTFIECRAMPQQAS